MRTQLKSMGLSLDWSREIATCDPEYYQHQQRMFLDFLAAGLVERKQSRVNWDRSTRRCWPNEQVIDGRGWARAPWWSSASSPNGSSGSQHFRRTCDRARPARALAGKVR